MPNTPSPGRFVCAVRGLEGSNAVASEKESNCLPGAQLLVESPPIAFWMGIVRDVHGAFTNGGGKCLY